MKIDFEKCGGLVPAIIQDAKTKNVLMLGYMEGNLLEPFTQLPLDERRDQRQLPEPGRHQD